MAVHSARSHDQVFSGNHFRCRADDEFRVHSVHGIGIPGFAGFDDAPVLNADIRLDDPPVIENHGVCNDYIQRAVVAFPRCAATLAHAVADHFSAAESDFIAIMCEVFLYLDDQIGIREPNPVALCWTIKIGIRAARNVEIQRFCSLPLERNPASWARRSARSRAPGAASSPSTKPLNPRITRRPPNALSSTSFSSPGSK